MPEPMEQKSSIQSFMSAGRIEKPVMPAQDSTLSIRDSIMPEPIPGTAYGSARKKWDEQKMLGNIPESVIAEADIVNLTNPKDDAKDNNLDIRDILRAMGARANTSEIEKFGNLLSNYEHNKESTSIESLQHQYEKLIIQGMKPIHSFFEKTVKQKKNAYPYDHRVAEATIEAAIDASETFKNEEWLKSSEGKVWLKVMERDSEWMANSFQIAVENSASLPYYYDVVQQMQILKERYRAYITDDDLQGAFADKIDGLELTDDENKIMNKTKIGLLLGDRYVKAGFVKKDETIGLRDLAIKLQDASFEHRMKIAAISQMDLTTTSPETTTFMGSNLNKFEADFYTKLLWRHKWNSSKKEGLGYILPPHIVSGSRSRKESESILEALLVTNASERLSAIQKNINEQDKIDATSILIDEIKAESLARQLNWKKRTNTDIVSNLSVLVTKQGLLQDYAFMHAYRYCWARQWNTDENGTAVSQKTIELGSIYSPSGDIPSLFWIHRAANYDGIANSRTQLLPPTSESWRNELAGLPPETVPHYDPDTHKDEFLKDRWDFLFSNEEKYKKERKEFDFKDMDPEFIDFLRRSAMVWGTPFTSGYLEKQADKGGYQLDIPIFFPPGLGIANFFETFTVQDGKLKDRSTLTVWDELVSGKKLSKINWKGNGLNVQPVDGWHVNMDMASRYMRPMIEIYDTEKDPFVNLVSGNPSTLGPKELAKRIRLSFKNDDEEGPSKYEVALIPFFVVEACANKFGLGSPRAWKKLESTDEVDRKTNSRPVDRFVREMSYWIRAFKWLPARRGDDTINYGNSMALLATYYMQVLLRVNKASAEESNYLAKKFNEESVKDLNAMSFVGNGMMNEKFTFLSIED